MTLILLALLVGLVAGVLAGVALTLVTRLRQRVDAASRYTHQVHRQLASLEVFCNARADAFVTQCNALEVKIGKALNAAGVGPKHVHLKPGATLTCDRCSPAVSFTTAEQWLEHVDQVHS